MKGQPDDPTQWGRQQKERNGFLTIGEHEYGEQEALNEPCFKLLSFYSGCTTPRSRCGRRVVPPGCGVSEKNAQRGGAAEACPGTRAFFVSGSSIQVCAGRRSKNKNNQASTPTRQDTLRASNLVLQRSLWKEISV